MAGAKVEELLIRLGVDVGDVKNKLGGVQDSLDRLAKQSEGAGGGFTKFQAKTVTLAAALDIARTAFDAIHGAVQRTGEFLADAVRESEADEAATAKLNAALKAAGEFTSSYSQALLDNAKALSQQTTATSTAIVDIERLLVSLGIAPSRIEEVTQAVLDLSSGLGVDAETGARAFARAMQGDFGALSKMGIVVDDTAKKAEQLDDVLAGIGRSLGAGVAADAKSYAAAMLDVKRGYGDTTDSGTKLEKQLESIRTKYNDKVAGEVERYANQFVKVSTAFKDAHAKADPLGKALAAVESRLGGQAAAEAATFAGMVAQTSNAYAELKRSIGDVVTQSEPLRNLIEGIKAAFEETTTFIENNRDALIDLENKGIRVALLGFQGLLESAREITTSLDFPEAVGAFDALIGKVKELRGGVEQAEAPIRRIGDLLTNEIDPATKLTIDVETETALEKFKDLATKITVLFAELGAQAAIEFVPAFFRELSKTLPNVFIKSDALVGKLKESVTQALTDMQRDLDRQELEGKLKFDLEFEPKTPELLAEIEQLKQRLQELTSPERKISLNIDSTGVDTGIATVSAALQTIQRPVSIPVSFETAGFETSLTALNVSLDTIRNTPVLIPIAFSAPAGGGIGGFGKGAAAGGGATAAGAAAGGLYGAAFAAQAAAQFRTEGPGLFNPIAADLAAGLASTFSNLGPMTIDVNGNVFMSGSPTLPATEYITSYLPALFETLAGQVADQEITLFSTAADVLKRGSAAALSDVRAAIGQLEAIQKRISPATREQLLKPSSVPFSPGGAAARDEILVIEGLIRELEKQSQLVTLQTGVMRDAREATAQLRAATDALRSTWRTDFTVGTVTLGASAPSTKSFEAALEPLREEVRSQSRATASTTREVGRDQVGELRGLRSDIRSGAFAASIGSAYEAAIRRVGRGV
jgi:hypothetical protein